jgi:hypothetical protein
MIFSREQVRVISNTVIGGESFVTVLIGVVGVHGGAGLKRR